VDELMEVSDLNVTKAGGLICSESIAKALPLIIIAPIPGQEGRNCRLLVKNRAAFQVRRSFELKKVISMMYRNTDILKEMRVNVRSIKRENPTMHIAGLVLKIIK
jgi:processive 1,2-diacylglycerol beta-glucosyltransferase